MIATIAIVGAGLAGTMTAHALRANGYDGRICLIGDEPIPAYDRPSLSKAVLTGEVPEAPALLDQDWYVTNSIEVQLGRRVTGIDAGNRRIVFEDGTSLAYDRLVLATGAHARWMTVPGAQLSGIHRLRHHADSVTLRQTLTSGRSLVVVGGGLIGCEVATTACKSGVDVTLLETADELLQRVLGRRIGLWCRSELEALGVHIELGTQVASFDGEGGHVTSVVLADGRRLPADAVLISIGADPADELARRAGIDCARGILVDGTGATSCSDVYAVGDVAAWPLRGGGQRSLETYLNSQAQAGIVAAAILGKLLPSPQVPIGWTEIAGHHLQMIGDPEGPGEIVVRGDSASGAPLMVFRVFEGRVEGAIAIDASKDFSVATRLVTAQIPVTVARLQDPSVNLRDLMKTQTSDTTSNTAGFIAADGNDPHTKECSNETER
uniref:Ferredoxin reductase component of biphenyl dioxygenase n=1 Tax=Dyella ginsengisoli TaxID=363848 RepID=A9QT33_9GAMM|nr:ferredoxin reductase component of biphenyl dioxygenase [Dyella ginsengisoli LA-4]